jgi:hypothetical protein
MEDLIVAIGPHHMRVWRGELESHEHRADAGQRHEKERRDDEAERDLLVIDAGKPTDESPRRFPDIDEPCLELRLAEIGIAKWFGGGTHFRLSR